MQGQRITVHTISSSDEEKTRETYCYTSPHEFFYNSLHQLAILLATVN